jgi:hypothetical protein
MEIQLGGAILTRYWICASTTKLNSRTDTYRANIIAESMYSLVDKDGNSNSLISEIVDHKKSDGTAVPPQGRRF